MSHRHEEFVEKALVILLDGREALPTPKYSKGGKRGMSRSLLNCEERRLGEIV